MNDAPLINHEDGKKHSKLTGNNRSLTSQWPGVTQPARTWYGIHDLRANCVFVSRSPQKVKSELEARVDEAKRMGIMMEFAQSETKYNKWFCHQPHM